MEDMHVGLAGKQNTEILGKWSLMLGFQKTTMWGKRMPKGEFWSGNRVWKADKSAVI